MNMIMKATKEIFEQKARIVHNNKYSYDDVVYINNKTKVLITCPKHGNFLQTPNKHLLGRGCPKCKSENFGKSLRSTLDQFIEKAKAVHGNTYDYSFVKYTTSRNKVLIICPIHGEFWQTPQAHLRSGCPQCGRKRTTSAHKISKEQFVAQCRTNHTIKYDYTKTIFRTLRDKVCITCPVHGDFFQNAGEHFRGANCPKCVGNALLTTEEFITKARLKHNNKYDYSKTKYVNRKTRVLIICPEHGEFWQTPQDHLAGKGCAKCVLKQQHILYDKLKLKFPNETLVWEYTAEWLGRQRIDICFEKYCIAIEYDGIQHFTPITRFGGDAKYKQQILDDKKKDIKCQENNFTLFRVKYNYSDLDFNVLCNQIQLKINEYGN